LFQSAGNLELSEVNEIKSSRGISVRYSDTGTGIPLLFIHGWLMSHRVWVLQASLASGYRVIALDLPGHGCAGTSEFSYASCCEAIALLIDRLKLERVIVVGWSMGAQIAIKAYASLHARIAGMVLVGATPSFCRNSHFPSGLEPAAARSMGLRLKRSYSRTAGEFFNSMFSPAEAGAIDVKLLASKVFSGLPSLDVAVTALQELVTSDLRSHLQSIVSPVMLIHGTEDKICLPGASMFMAEKIPMATIELIPSAGHAPFLANPERFNRTLSSFVQAVHG